MLLTTDAGNTNIVFTIYNDDRLVLESRINTDSSRMADQYAIILMDILHLYNLSPQDITGAIISSVVPPVTMQLKIAVERLCSVQVMLVGPGIKTGLNIKIDEPNTLGADLVCGAVAAKKIYIMPCIIIDLGTVTKIMALDKEGSLIGGIFYPGVRISLEALSARTAALPLVSAEKVENVIATNAADSIRSGILNGTACMLDGMIGRFEKVVGTSTIIATGGHAPQVRPYCERTFDINPQLVAEGLRIIYNKNK